jgi:hypothetical protein
MLVAFNTVTVFPGDYNGGDPLGAHNPAQVKMHVEKMIRAVAGDAQAKAWFASEEAKVYCAELAHLSISAGILFPLNRETWGPIVGDDVWTKFEQQIAAHNEKLPDAFTKDNRNPNINKISLTTAPADLKPITEYAPPEEQAKIKDKLAFQPMTIADIIEEFLRTHVPREQMGEQVAPVQAGMLKGMKPQILQAMGLDAVPEADPRRQAVEAFYAQLIEVVGKPYGSYQEFRAALEPMLEQARKLTGPQGGDGKGLFVPPSMFHSIAQGGHPGGLIDLEYVGHGVHYSHVRKAREQP